MTDENELTKLMAMEERLKGIAYQFIALYERWAEDRQEAAKQGANTAELVRIFTEQVKGFKELAPQVRQQIVNSIQNAATEVGKVMGEQLCKSSTSATESMACRLSKSVDHAEKVLSAYQCEVAISQWKVIVIAALATIITCFFIVKFLMPAPAVPLTEEQIKYLQSGEMMALVWPKLSKKEREDWRNLAAEFGHPE